MVSHFHHRDRSDPFIQEHPWVESYVKRVQSKAHLLLQGMQPGKHDGTKRATEEAVKVHGNESSARIGIRWGNRGELVHDPSVTQKARNAGEEMKQRPTQAQHAHHPQQGSNPVAFITEISQTGNV